MSNISTCEAVELVRNAIDPYSMMGISADDMVYASVKRHMLSLFEKPEGECLHRISFAEFADKVTKTTRIQGEWVDEIPVFEPGDDYGQYTWNKRIQSVKNTPQDEAVWLASSSTAKASSLSTALWTS